MKKQACQDSFGSGTGAHSLDHMTSCSRKVFRTPQQESNRLRAKPPNSWYVPSDIVLLHRLHCRQPLPSSQTKSSKRTASTSASTVTRVTPRATRHDSPQVDPEDPENLKLDSRYAGDWNLTIEDPECFNPDIVKQMEFEDRAIWLGKWFAHHYAPWVMEIYLREMQTYKADKGDPHQDSVVAPVKMLHHTFYRFQVPENEWRSPSFCSPVCFLPSQTNSSTHLLQVSARPQTFPL